MLFVAFLFTFRSVYFVHYESTTWADVAVFMIFLCSAIFCLSSSALYHTAGAHSEPVRVSFMARGYRVLICHYRFPPGATLWIIQELSVCNAPGYIFKHSSAAHLVFLPQYSPSGRSFRVSTTGSSASLTTKHSTSHAYAWSDLVSCAALICLHSSVGCFLA